jgi:membrane protein
MLICPVLFIASSSATVFIAAKITGITSQAALTQPFNPLIISMVRLLPIIVIWILFTFIYFFMPNGKINFRSALLGGIIAGSLYQGLQEFYVFIQVALSKYNAIYGSFSALPLFLIWLRLSWLIVLFGAEISFADQNVENTEFEPDCRKVSLTYKKLLALWITRFTVFRFCAEELPPKDSEITEKLGIPVKLLREIVSKLVHSGVLAERNIENTDLTGYCPAVSTDKITIKYVIDAMESDSVEQLPVKKDEVYEKLLENMKILAENIEKSPANVLLKNL